MRLTKYFKDICSKYNEFNTLIYLFESIPVHCFNGNCFTCDYPGCLNASVRMQSTNYFKDISSEIQ